MMHQYIGARYVPTYYQNSLDPDSTEWEANVNYEPLTIVTLPNLHSYISKKYVPDTIGTPASNAEYWLDQGYANAYIQALQDQIDDMNDGTVSGSLQNQINGLNDDVTDLDLKIEKRYVLLFDSYGNYPDANSVSLMNLVAGAFKHAEAYYQGGIGFTNVNGQGTFTDLLTSLTISEPEKVTDIIVCGGQNDYGQDGSVIAAGISTFIAYANTKCPNAKISIGHTSAHRNLINGTMRDAVYSNYISINAYRACVNQGAFYLNNVEYIMHSSALYVAGGMNHPNPTGVTRLARGIINAIETGSTNVNYENEITPTPQFGSTYSSVVFSTDLIKQIVINGVSILRCTPNGRITVTKSEDGYLPTNEFQVGYLDPDSVTINIVGDNAPSQYTTIECICLSFDSNDNYLGFCPGSLRLDGNDNIRISLAPGIGSYNGNQVHQFVLVNFGEVSIRSINC